MLGIYAKSTAEGMPRNNPRTYGTGRPVCGSGDHPRHVRQDGTGSVGILPLSILPPGCGREVTFRLGPPLSPWGCGLSHKGKIGVGVNPPPASSTRKGGSAEVLSPEKGEGARSPSPAAPCEVRAVVQPHRRPGDLLRDASKAVFRGVGIVSTCSSTLLPAA